MVERKPLVLGNKSYKDITDDICEPVETVPGAGWIALFFSAKSLLLFYLTSVGIILFTGMGLMGTNHPVGWGTDIVTFVFWIGIGHAGTLISAIFIFVPPKMANFGGAIGRSHDRFCGNDGGNLPTDSYRSTLA